MQPENVGNAICENRKRSSWAKVRIGNRRIIEKRMTIVSLGGADEDAHIGIRNRRRPNAGILECFPRELKEDPLLRIDWNGFARRNAEWRRVQAPDVIQYTRGPRVTSPSFLAPRRPESSE